MFLSLICFNNDFYYECQRAEDCSVPNSCCSHNLSHLSKPWPWHLLFTLSGEGSLWLFLRLQAPYSLLSHNPQVWAPEKVPEMRSLEHCVPLEPLCWLCPWICLATLHCFPHHHLHIRAQQHSQDSSAHLGTLIFVCKWNLLISSRGIKQPATTKNWTIHILNLANLKVSLLFLVLVLLIK